MDSEKILIAIEEKKKWEERAIEIEKQLDELKEKKTQLHAELKLVDGKLKYYSALADSFREYNNVKASGRYFFDGSTQMR